MAPLNGGHIATATNVAIVPNSFAFGTGPDLFSCGNCWRRRSAFDHDAVAAAAVDAADVHFGGLQEPGNLKSGTDYVLLERYSATCDDHLLGVRTRSQLTRRLVLDQPRCYADDAAYSAGTTSNQFNSLSQPK